MKIIVIHGAPAVGKLTIAQSLAKKTGYVILHNHLTIDLALQIFPFASKPFNRLIKKIRLIIVKEAIKERIPGIIWTTGLPNNSDIAVFYKKLDKLIESVAGSTHYVHVTCDFEEQKKRVKGTSRKKFRKPRTVKQLTKSLAEIDYTPGYRGKSRFHLDSTHLPPQKAAEQIIKYFKLSKNKNRRTK
ncbi:MAG: hypothetical protein ACOZAJ_02165 [Patescibacteria group bacterium]